jgi:serine/threonine protein kinase
MNGTPLRRKPIRKISINERWITQHPDVLLNYREESALEDFEYRKGLGQGRFGEVGLYHHKALGIDYAVKKIDKVDPIMKGQIQREVKFLAELQHPNIIRLCNWFEDNDHIFVVLEYASEGDLYNYTKARGNKFIESQILGYVTAIISALYHLHNLPDPIMHRDIKPDNMLITSKGILKLSDFGSSNFSRTKDDRRTLLATEKYMAPEYIPPIKHGHDSKVDIWALGVMVYELLTGRTPFEPDNNDLTEFEYNALLRKNISYKKIDFPPSMSRPMREFIKFMLNKDPAARPDINQVIEHAWLKKNNILITKYEPEVQPIDEKTKRKFSKVKDFFGESMDSKGLPEERVSMLNNLQHDKTFANEYKKLKESQMSLANQQPSGISNSKSQTPNFLSMDMGGVKLVKQPSNKLWLEENEKLRVQLAELEKELAGIDSENADLESTEAQFNQSIKGHSDAISIQPIFFNQKPF